MSFCIGKLLNIVAFEKTSLSSCIIVGKTVLLENDAVDNEKRVSGCT